ncbi:MAG: PQQ-binding-like beta-propeller repeat protein [Gemmataceae bacterium]
MRSLKWYLSGWILMLAGLPWAQADDWSQFRGPNCQGVSTEKKPLPVEFSATNQARWSAVVGEGVGSPVVASGRVFTTAMTPEGAGSRQLRVFAFDAATGKELWRKDLDAGPRPFAPIHPVSSYASATPLADAERVRLLRTHPRPDRAGCPHQREGLEPPRTVLHLRLGPGHVASAASRHHLFRQDDDLPHTVRHRCTGKVRWKDDRSGHGRELPAPRHL